MTPTADREKAALPIDAEPIALHLRLNAVEATSKKILRRIGRSHRALKSEISDGFKKCSQTRPCAKPPEPPAPATVSAGFDFASWQKVVAGLIAIGALAAGFTMGPSPKALPQTIVSSQPAAGTPPAHP